MHGAHRWMGDAQDSALLEAPLFNPQRPRWKRERFPIADGMPEGPEIKGLCRVVAKGSFASPQRVNTARIPGIPHRRVGSGRVLLVRKCLCDSQLDQPFDQGLR